ncbi:hypothetical protein Poly51_03500 [Rubripirellula tenax]|uniref:Uncharacterized protein n=1 Tax=Rubripirellula tenax TaxID=2528015 RepID=A0A5C6FE41_9BACT|nr:hypothetical protein [Rubripirellula tenax]TWU60076.1 hypothetical protein Poly51_03500 [Rubripirellula tenax]
MRLTLRTLLAYLDNTLEPQDAEILRTKLAESGFATQLVQRLRAGLINPSLGAPRPDAVGPNDDANVIAEYLDSTLPTEQVAEIERACLESDSRLAEAAACHQILTMVLGKSADVPPALRSRIYELPEREIERIAASSTRFSSLTMDGPPPVTVDALGGALKSGLAPLTDVSELPTMDSPLTHTGDPVTPVGPADSGVSDAPTRLREAGVTATVASSGGKGPAMAGSKKRDPNDTAIYGGLVRTSRITPWLVSLALAGVLLFALSRIFAPLLNRDDSVAQLDGTKTLDPSGLDPSGLDPSGLDPAGFDPSEIDAPIDMTPPMESIPTPENAIDDEAFSDAEMLPPPAPSRDVDSEPNLGRERAAQPEAEFEMTDDFDDAEFMPPPKPSVLASPTADGVGDDEAMEVELPGPAALPPPEAMASIAADPPMADELPLATDPPRLAQPATEVATITTENSLIATNKGVGGGAPKWVRLKKGMTVVPGYPVVCPPTFRATMTSVSGFDVTLVGPAEAVWVADEEGESAIAIVSGRVLIKSNRPNARIDIALGNELVTLSFAESASVVAASIKHFRAPGLDPLEADNRIELAGVLAVQGAVGLSSDNDQSELTTRQQWVKRSGGKPMVSPVDGVPPWVDPADPAATSIEAGAREGLLELIASDQPLEITLREATLFRRSEVASLAAQTLLHMGQGDVYFGSDGILSETKQRAYWPQHYLELLSVVDRSAASASQLEKSIVRMDAANAVPMFRLLTGYSQKQLIEGGDEELVRLLDSEAMAVRVLALENLHKMTGTTLYFRAEQDNAVRREPGIKKWVARQRKGDIRWNEGGQ